MLRNFNRLSCKSCSVVAWRLCTTSSVLVDKDPSGYVVSVSLNDIPTRNSLSLKLMQDLRNTLSDIADSGARVVVLRSNTPKVFSSGHNLKEILSKEDLNGLFRLCVNLMRDVRAMPQAVIAEVDGVATAAGCQLVASCDLAVATTTSKFATPGVNIGLFCSTPAVAVARNVSYKHAMEMLLTGDFIDANHAQRIGLINRVVAPEELQKEVQKLSFQIASKSPQVIAFGKGIFQKQIELNEKDAYDLTAEAMVTNMDFADAENGIAAFLEKRTPVF